MHMQTAAESLKFGDSDTQRCMFVQRQNELLRASAAAAFILIVSDSSACRHSCRSFNLQRQYQ
jgi:hypothetical protein